MIAPFDRFAEQLTIEERREIWVAISIPGVSRSRFHHVRGAAIGAAAVVATLIAVFVIREQLSEGFGRIESPKRATARVKLNGGSGHAKETTSGPDRGTPVLERDASSSTVHRRSPGGERETRAVRIPTAAIQGLFPSAANIEVEPRVIFPETSNGNDARPPAAGAGVVSGRITNAQNQLNEIEVKAQRQLDSRSSTTRQSISGDKIKNLPVDNLSQAVGTKAGVVARGGDLHFRGGRSGEVRIQLDGTSELPDPLVPTTDGTPRPEGKAFDSMFFKNYGVNPFVATDEDPRSTFAVDVDAASYTVTRRYLELGQLPPKEAVRVEEFVNYVPQDYPRFEDDDFRILIDGAPSRFGSGYHLLRIGIKAREIPAGSRKPAQLTFVIDVSGSMAREDRLELVKRALRLLVKQLDEDDRVAIVVYGTQGRVILGPTAVDANASHAGRQLILDTIEQLHPEGSTNAEEGLQLGYELARRHYRAEASNRIVLCSDGVANVGRTGAESILAQVRGDAGRGIHLTAIGFGMGNYNDVLMEQLANQGDGNYYYVDDIDEAHRVFIDHLTGTLETIAKDAKVQVEFDATRVLRYRLLGFENRDVADRDFRNDDVDAGEIGAGHEVTALYELELARGVERGTLAIVRFRYARPDGKGSAPQVREIEERFDVEQLSEEFEDAAPAFRLDAATAELAEILRGSYWAKDGRWSDVLSVARSASRDLRDEASADVVRVIEKAARLGKPSRSDSR